MRGNPEARSKSKAKERARKEEMSGYSESRSWLIYVGVAVASVSFVLHVVSISLMLVLWRKTDDVADRTNLGKEALFGAERGQDGGSVEHSTDKRSSSTTEIENLRRQIEDSTKDRRKIRKILEGVELQLKKATKQLSESNAVSWKRGCSEFGITNGTTCLVLIDEKRNYSQAIDHCKEKNGHLLASHDTNVVNALVEFFPRIPLLIDARFNPISGMWMTSAGEVADFLPWKASYRGSSGDCCYAYGEGLQRWHCHARLSYVCAF